jgi:hypothetical protein
LLTSALIAAALALTPPVAADDADAIAQQYFPEQLIANSQLDQERGGYVPRRLQAVTTRDAWIFAAYSDGYSGVVRVVERNANGTRLVAESNSGNMAGSATRDPPAGP